MGISVECREMPLYFNAIQRDYIIPASIAAGLGKIGWHCLRHTYRDWLNEAGTELGAQQKLMRHSPPAMTAKYGGKKVGKGMREANSRIVQMVSSKLNPPPRTRLCSRGGNKWLTG